MTKELLEQSIVHSVAKHGIPIRYFSSPAYKLAVGQLASSVGLSLHRDNVRKCHQCGRQPEGRAQKGSGGEAGLCEG